MKANCFSCFIVWVSKRKCFNKMGSTSHNPRSLADTRYRERPYSSSEDGQRMSDDELELAGFYYTDYRENVQCVVCNMIIDTKRFPSIRAIVDDHHENSPTCSLFDRRGDPRVESTGTHGINNPDQSASTLSNNDSSGCGSAAGAGSSASSSGTSGTSSDGSNTSNSTKGRSVECKGFHTFDSLRYERERRATFIDWPVPWLSPETLAREGFYYLRVADHCSCVFCRGIVGAWEPGDIPSQEHKRHFPKCPFVRGQPVGNVPIAQGDLLASLPTDGPCPPSSGSSSTQSSTPTSPVGGATMGQNNNNNNNNTAAEATPPFTLNSTRNSVNINAELMSPTCSAGGDEFPVDGAADYVGPRRKEYLTKESRIKSFKNWPQIVKQTPAELAEAGFYYCGLSDHVRCFHCGNGLRNWEADDQPWVEHARWYPQCNFVLLSKGLDYIDQVRRENPPYFRTSQDVGSAEAAATSSAGAALSPSEPSRPSPYVSNTYTSNVLSTYRVRITDAQLDQLMDLDVQKAVLAMGFDVQAVKRALRKKIEQTGVPFFNLESCIESVLECVEEGADAGAASSEAQRHQEAKLSSFQNQRLQSNDNSRPNPSDGEDVVNTPQRPLAVSLSSPTTSSNTATTDVISSRQPVRHGGRTPIITSPVMPPRRIVDERVRREQERQRQAMSDGADLSVASLHALRPHDPVNIPIGLSRLRQQAFHSSEDIRGYRHTPNDPNLPLFPRTLLTDHIPTAVLQRRHRMNRERRRRRGEDNQSAQSMETGDIIEYPVLPRSQSINSQRRRRSFVASTRRSERDVTPTNDYNIELRDEPRLLLVNDTRRRNNSFPATSTSSDSSFDSESDSDSESMETTEQHEESFPTRFSPDDMSSSPAASAGSSAGSSGPSSVVAASADPVSLEMMSQVDKVISLAEKEQKRVCRNLSSCSSASQCSRTGSSCGGGGGGGGCCSASEGEHSGTEEAAGSSVSEGEADNTEEQLNAAKKQVSALSDQVERLRESRMCKICMDAELSVVLLPCLHMSTCASCTLALENCPICRALIKQVLLPKIVA